MNVRFSLKNGAVIELRSDDKNYELCQVRQRTNEATGEVSEEVTAFKWFGGLEQALNRILDMKLRASDAKTLKELRADLAAAREEITAVWSTATRAA